MASRRSVLKLGAAAVLAPVFNKGRFTLPQLMRHAVVVDMLAPLQVGTAGQRWLRTPSSISAEDFAPYLASGINVFHTAVGFGGPDAYTTGQQFFHRQNSMIAERPDLFMRIDSADDFARVK